MTKRILALACILLPLAFSTALSAQTIFSQPQSETVNNASTATFNVGASNALSYQWEFNGSPLASQTNSILTLEDVNTSQAGTYTVVVGGSGSNLVTSSEAVLNLVPGTIVEFTFSGLLTNAPTNTLDVQLFDHDKPVTVQNFIHYIRAGGYTNMFMDRLNPDFVLQGGDYGASNQTSSTPPLNGWDIDEMFTDSSDQPNPPYPNHIDNEFSVGPLIHNSFGTIAMAQASGDTNSANTAFYFNLIDNSSSLDSQDFVVFGRVLDQSTNLLQYFNTLTVGNGGISSASFVTPDGTNQIPGISGSFLPVNYTGTNAPANSNLLFVNFSFLSGPTIDTTPPTVALASNLSGGLITNGLVAGTATDDFGIADVIVYLQADGTNTVTTNYATGTTNWSYAINGGSYTVTVQAQDGAGNLSAPVMTHVTNTAVAVIGEGTVKFTGSMSNSSPLGYNLQTGTGYGFQAVAAAGYTFLHWNYMDEYSTNATIGLTYQGGLLTATFIQSNTPPRIKGVVSYVYPRANAIIPTTSFTLKGSINRAFGAAHITSLIFSQTTGLQVGEIFNVNGTTTWSINITNLPPDYYVIQSVATNSKYSTVINEGFTVEAFKSVAGQFNGLFLCTTEPVAPTNSGYIKLMLTPAGNYSAVLYFPTFGQAPTDYKFTVGGSSQSPYPILLNNPLSLDLNLDFTNNPQIMTGTLTSQHWTADVVCYRAAARLSARTTPATGKYIIDLSPTSGPETNGYATASVTPGGAVIVGGALPDGSTFSQSTTISTNGIWPLYAVPSGYKTNGMVMGWMTNQPGGGCSGQIYWFKNTNVGTYYTGGVNTLMDAEGTNSFAPAEGNYTLVFDGGANTGPITNTLAVARAGGPFKAEDNTDKLAISLAPTGVLSGHVFDSSLNVTLQFKGGFFGTTNGGSGFVLEGDGKTGAFALTHQ